MKLVTVVQARTGSSRLPGKVLLPVQGKTLLERMAERVQAAKHSGVVVVATTTDPSDDEVAALCKKTGLNCFRGHPTDLLDRHYQAAKEYGAQAVVKIPSDCPLIDPQVIDRVLGAYLATPDQWDYLSNLHPATYPDGNDVELMPFSVLEAAWKEATLPMEREHTTPFIWERPERFRIGNIAWESGLDYSMSHRWTIDYKEDYEFIRAVYDELFPTNPVFALNQILDLLTRKPELRQINEMHVGVNWYRHHLEDLRTIQPHQTRFERSTRAE